MKHKLLPSHTKMSTRGQVIIPKSIRNQLDLEKSSEFDVIALSDDIILLKKIDREKMLKEFRKMRAKIKEKMSMDEINELIQEVRREKRRSGQ